MPKRFVPSSGQLADQWRELIRPIVMEMHRCGITELELIRDGLKVVMNLTVDNPSPELIELLDDHDQNNHDQNNHDGAKR